MTSTLLHEIKSRPCILSDSKGNEVGQAICRVDIPAYHAQSSTIILPGQSNEWVVPRVEPTVKVYEVTGCDSKELTRVTSITTTIHSGEGEYYEVCIESVKFAASNASSVFDASLVQISEIGRTKYEELSTSKRPIDWSKIIIPDGGTTQDYAFEELVREIATKNPRYTKYIFLSQGTDGGRDAEYTFYEEPFPSLTTTRKCIIQCKYSQNIKKSISKTEVYDEMVKIMGFKPDHYILVTNRNVTKSFTDWFYSDGLKERFPYKIHLVQRQFLETRVRSYTDLLIKYFG